MKKINVYAFSLLIAVILSDYTYAQNERRTPQTRRGNTEQRNTDRNARRGDNQNNNNADDEVSVRARNMNQQQIKDLENTPWTRIIYREIDLTKEKNAPLYYPLTPANGMQSLFTTIFQLAANGKLNLYQYLDGYEVFDQEHLVNFKEMLDRFEILYEVKNNAGTQTFTVNESDVPAQEVKAFYVKEAWFFDQNNSVYDVKILALCPVIYRNLDFGEQHTPMCWVAYDDVKTHLANNYIMTSNLNNAKNLNMDDYFRRRMFEGEIVRTENLLNLPLQAYCPTPDSMAKEQERIEKELESFQESLWIIPDTTTQIVLSSKDAKKAAKEAKKNAGKEKSESKDKAITKEKATKEKSAAASKSDTTPTRSVRRSR